MTFRLVMIAGCAAVLLAGPAASQEQTPIVNGRDEFVWNCADCHGQAGRGDGPLAAALIKSPSDLTKIAHRNLGIFPAQKIFDIVAGQESVVGHQSFQMPKYWERFKQTPGQRDFVAPEVRIRAIVEYLRQIQAP
jgi:mono/diheme cytochrome c family protein